VCVSARLLATPPVVDVHGRTSGRGAGGVAAIYRQHLKCWPVSLPACRAVEMI